MNQSVANEFYLWTIPLLRKVTSLKLVNGVLEKQAVC